MEQVYRDDQARRTGRGIVLQLGLAALLALALALALTGIGRANNCSAQDCFDQGNPQPGNVHSSGPILGPSTATGDTGDYPAIGQTFTAGITGTLDRVQVKLGKTGTFTDTASVDVKIYAVDSQDYPTGSALASASIPVSSISTSFPGAFVEADFSSGPSVFNGTVYAIVLTCDEGCASGLIEWNTSECTGPPPTYVEICDYPGGRQFYLKDGQWTSAYENADDDHIFQTYVIPNNKQDQTINFGTLSDKTYGDAPFNISATASSGLPVSFTSKTPGVCTYDTSLHFAPTITIVGAGTCTIEASQSGNLQYNPAPNVDQSFTVNKATPAVNWNPPSPVLYYGQPLPDSYFNPGANATGIGYPTPEAVNGTFSYTYSGTTNGGQTISGSASTSTVLPAGSYTLTATFTSSNSNYSSGGSASVPFTINKTTPSVSWTPSIDLPSHDWEGYTIYDMTYGTPFTAGELDGTAMDKYTGGSIAGVFSYKYPLNQAADVVTVGTVLPVKPGTEPNNVYAIRTFFTPDDTADFTNASTNAYLFEVDPAPLTVSANDQTMTYGDAVPDLTVSYTGFVNNEDDSVLSGSVSCVVKDQSGNQIDPSTALPGKYAIDCSSSTLSDINYTINYVSGTLIIDPIQTTTVPTDLTVITGTASVALGATVSSTDPNHPVNEGTVTFSVTQGTAVLCTSQAVAVTSSSVANVPCDFAMSPPTGSYTITATYQDQATNAIFTGSGGSGTLTITNGVTVVGGEPIVVRHNYWALVELQVVDASGNDISSRTLKVTAENLAPAGQSWDGTDANFVHAFQFGPAFGGHGHGKPSGGYRLAINSRPLSIGDYTLSYTIAGDPVIHAVTIRVVP